jgi:hypothetical protein
METGINNLKDFLELIIGFVGAGSLAIAAYSYYLGKKQLNFAVIINCTERFQKIISQLDSNDPTEKEKAIGLYIDLCNEELFYWSQPLVQNYALSVQDFSCYTLSKSDKRAT